MSRTHRRLGAADLARVAAFAGLIAVLGLPGKILLFGGQVPVTAQTLGVMLAGSILGARRGALAVLVFLALVALGLPLLAGGRGGLGVLAGPSAGFLIGWVAGAWVTGRLVELRAARRYGYRSGWGFLANVLGGLLVVYALGVPVLAWRTDVSLSAALLATLVFVPGDLLKAALATLVASGVHKALPDLGPAAPAAPTRAGVAD